MLTIRNAYKKPASIVICLISAALTITGFIVAIQMDENLNGFHVDNLLNAGNVNLQATSLLALFMYIVSTLLLCLWYMHNLKHFHRINLYALLLAMALSFFAIVGYSQEISNKQFLFFNQTRCVEILAYIGFVILAYTLIVNLFHCFDRFSGPRKSTPPAKSRILLYSLAIGIILMGWLPFLIANYPGSVPYDTHKQLLEAAGQRNLNASNPILVTYLYGTLFSLGRTLLNDHFGIFMCTLFQLILWLVATSQCCVYVYHMSKSKAAYWLSVAFYAIIPMWGASIQCVLKDNVHTGFFLLYLLSYYHCSTTEGLKAGDCVKLFAFSVLAGLTRKSATAIIIISLLLLIGFRWKKALSKKKLMIVSASVMSVFVIINVLISNLPGIVAPMERENYSLPFQQIARYCTKYGSELSDEEITIINQVLDYDTIVAQYTPDVSDTVKATFHSSASEMSDFWKLYVRLGLRHPEVYIEHLFAGTYKYNYPLSSGNAPYRQYIQKDESFYQVDYASTTSLNSIKSYFAQWQNGTFTTLFIGPGLYVWVFLILIAYALHKKRYRAVVMMSPVIILYGGLFLSHVNGENRYAMPLMAAIPLCMAISFHASPNKEALLKE